MERFAPAPENAAKRAPDDSFVKWIEQYGAALLRFFRRRIPDAHDADDALQDTYVRLLKYRDREHMEAPQALAFRIAESVVCDRQRRRASHRVDAHVPFADDDDPATGAGPEHVACAGQELGVLAEAIGELSPKCRRVFLMSRLHGLKRQDIADRLGISVQMVDKHLGRAMAYCRRKVEGSAS